MSKSQQEEDDYAGEGSEDPLEARSSMRVGSDVPVEIQSLEFSGHLAGRTRDISIGGACIATESPFDFKSVHHLGMMLPRATISVECEGRWQREEPSGDLILTGFEFSDPGDSELDAIWDLVLESGHQLARFLYEHSALRELGLEEAMGLAQVTRFRNVPPGQTLYRQGSWRRGEDSIYIILKGSVVLQLRVRDAIETEIARLGRGDLFGGLPMLTNVPHCESAVADEEVHLLEIDREAYRYVRMAKPWLGHRLSSALLRISAVRFHQLMGHVSDRL